MNKIAVVCAGIALALGASMAHATKPGNNGGGNGGCGVGQTTNGCGGSGSGSNTATGGAGGNGYGGTGVGVGVGVGIGQGGAGGAGGNGYASNSNSNANSGNNSDQSVTVNGDNYDAPRIPVATAYAAPLAASNGTCMGSSSAGFQGMAVGISVGTTWNDTSCDMRYDAEALRLAGMPLAAVARLCQKAEIADAMKAAGTPCPGTKQEVAAAPDDVRPTAALVVAEQHQPKYVASAPIVVSPVPPRIERFRVTVDGLQPL